MRDIRSKLVRMTQLINRKSSADYEMTPKMRRNVFQMFFLSIRKTNNFTNIDTFDNYNELNVTEKVSS